MALIRKYNTGGPTTTSTPGQLTFNGTVYHWDEIKDSLNEIGTSITNPREREMFSKLVDALSTGKYTYDSGINELKPTGEQTAINWDVSERTNRRIHKSPTGAGEVLEHLFPGDVRAIRRTISRLSQLAPSMKVNVTDMSEGRILTYGGEHDNWTYSSSLENDRVLQRLNSIKQLIDSKYSEDDRNKFRGPSDWASIKSWAETKEGEDAKTNLEILIERIKNPGGALTEGDISSLRSLGIRVVAPKPPAATPTPTTPTKPDDNGTSDSNNVGEGESEDTGQSQKGNTDETENTNGPKVVEPKKVGDGFAWWHIDDKGKVWLNTPAFNDDRLLNGRWLQMPDQFADIFKDDDFWTAAQSNTRDWENFVTYARSAVRSDISQMFMPLHEYTKSWFDKWLTPDVLKAWNRHRIFINNERATGMEREKEYTKPFLKKNGGILKAQVGTKLFNKLADSKLWQHIPGLLDLGSLAYVTHQNKKLGDLQKSVINDAYAASVPAMPTEYTPSFYDPSKRIYDQQIESTLQTKPISSDALQTGVLQTLNNDKRIGLALDYNRNLSQTWDKFSTNLSASRLQQAGMRNTVENRRRQANAQRISALGGVDVKIGDINTDAMNRWWADYRKKISYDQTRLTAIKNQQNSRKAQLLFDQRLVEAYNKLKKPELGEYKSIQEYMQAMHPEITSSIYNDVYNETFKDNLNNTYWASGLPWNWFVNTPESPKSAGTTNNTTFIKKGGIIKAEKGTEIPQQHGEFPRYLHRPYNRAGNSSDADKWTDPDKWTAADTAEILSTIGTAAAAGFAFFPGAGTIASAGLGMASSLAQAWADAQRGDKWGANLVANLGMDVLTLVPGGGAAKIAKSLPKLQKAVKFLNAAGYGIAATGIVAGIDQISRDPDNVAGWKHLFNSIRYAAPMLRGLIGKTFKFPKGGANQAGKPQEVQRVNTNGDIIEANPPKPATPEPTVAPSSNSSGDVAVVPARQPMTPSNVSPEVIHVPRSSVVNNAVITPSGSSVVMPTGNITVSPGYDEWWQFIPYRNPRVLPKGSTTLLLPSGPRAYGDNFVMYKKGGKVRSFVEQAELDRRRDFAKTILEQNKQINKIILMMLSNEN